MGSCNLRLAVWGVVLALGSATSPAVAQDGGSLSQTSNACDGSSTSVTAAADETVDIVFPNGGSVTLAPGASAEVGCTAAGGLTVTLATGLLRVTTGPGAPPALVRTAGATMTLNDGAALVAAESGATRVHLLTGSELIVAAGGAERRLFRPGFEVVATDGSLSRPRRMSAEEVVADLRRINPGLATGIPPRSEAGTPGAAAGGQVASAVPEAPAEDAPVLRLGTPLPPPEVGLDDGDGGGTDQPSQPEAPGFDDGLGTIDLAAAFGASVGVNAASVDEQSTSTVFGANVLRWQEAVEDDTPFSPIGLGNLTGRTFGPVTNSLYGSSALTQDVGPDVGSIAPGEGGLSYVSGTNLFGLKPASETRGFDIVGRFLFDPAPLPAEGVFSTNTQRLATGDSVSDATSSPNLRSDSAFGVYPETAVELGSGAFYWEGRGAFTTGLTFGHAICKGSSDCTANAREADNFVLLDMQPGLAFTLFCGALADCEAERDSRIAALQAKAGNTEAPLVQEGDGISVDPQYSVLLRDNTATAHAIFAAGDLDGLVAQPSPGASVDTFYLSSGMAGEILDGVDGTLPWGMDRSSGALRAFARDETWIDLDKRTGGFGLSGSDVRDSGLFVINPTGAVLGTGNTSKVLHADVALTGAGTAQVSTISATIGEVEFRFSNLDASNPTNTEADAFLTARTIGSSQGLTLAGLTGASTLIAGDVISTAAGGGNPNPGYTAAGRLGFMVLENAGDVFVNGARTEVLTGGRERPMGDDPAAPDRSFALARLGVGASSEGIPSRFGFSDGDWGYAAGFVEAEAGGTVALARLRADETAPNLTFSGFSSARNEVSATLTWHGGTLPLGGGDGQSAYLDDDRFGLRSATSGADLAMVSGDLVVDGLADAGPAPRDYDYVKWGFFFGDAKAAPNGERRHVHLGSFAAGQRLTAQQGLSVTNPVITYRGHAAGNVRNGNRVYTALGTFEDSFDFGRRQGTATISLDGRTLSGPSVAPQNLQSYGGAVSGAGGFSGTLNGRFVGPLVDKGPGLAPAGIVGGFGVRDAGTSYRATGTFAAEQ